METIAKPEAISEERVRSIFYSSFDISQGDSDLQAMLLARVFAGHPDIKKKFAEMDVEKDSILMNQLTKKQESAHNIENVGTAEDEISKQVKRIQGYFDRNSNGILKEEFLLNIVSILLSRDWKYASGRTRDIRGEEKTIYKFYLIEHGLSNTPYRGDPVWQEFFDSVYHFLQTYRLSTHAGKLGEYREEIIRQYFSKYNELVRSGKYTNKNCKEIDYKGLPLFS